MEVLSDFIFYMKFMNFFFKDVLFDLKKPESTQSFCAI